MENNKKIRKLPQKLLHGGDYNPDQWLDCPEVLEEDIKLMKEAHVNCVSLGIFAWGKLEPEEGRYDLDWLGEIIDRLFENGISTILATPTGAMPHWMTEKYEETRQVLANGIRKLPGGRHNFCPSSPVVREKMRGIDRALSRRFGQHPGVIAWHLSNEYAGGGGDNGDGACYCPLCQENFRRWLKKRYQTLDNLNHAWWTGFWSNTFTDWGQIHAPSPIGEYTMDGLKLDWKRFVSEQMVDFCREEAETVKEFSDRPVVTNLMGTFKPIDYFKLAETLDIASLDNYPFWHWMEDESEMAAVSSLAHTLTRSLKKQPYLLMESVPSAVQWAPKNVLKRPGMHELSSLQAIACGSDSVQYFQWRKGRGGSEKFHGAVVDHKNGGNTRVFRDVTALGKRLENIALKVLGTCNRPKAALVFDWENWWAADDTAAVVNPFDYRRRWQKYYRPFWEQGIDVDIIDMDDPMTEYDVVIAPYNYMYRGNYAENVRRFVSEGGVYVTTCWSGEVGESSLCFTGSHPLRDVLGIRTEEADVMPDYVRNHVVWGDKKYSITDICALVHAESAEVLGVYEKDFYAGYPALTVNTYGKGKAYFIASENEQTFYGDFLRSLAAETGIACTLRVSGDLPHGVTVNERKREEGKDAAEDGGAGSSLWFVQNFNGQETKLTFDDSYRDIETGKEMAGEIVLKPWQCLILEKKR